MYMSHVHRYMLPSDSIALRVNTPACALNDPCNVLALSTFTGHQTHCTHHTNHVAKMENKKLYVCVYTVAVEYIMFIVAA